MSENLDNYIKDTMINLPAGIETIRSFRDKKKWISSNYKMSIPSSGRNQEQTTENIEIAAFQIAKYPVTNEFYDFIMNSGETTAENKLLPKVNISWYDAVKFCNAVSRHFGFSEYYHFDNNGLAVTPNPDSNGFRLPTDAEWQYACKAGKNKYQYSEIDTIAWHQENSNGKLHNVGEKIPNEWNLCDMLGNIWEWCWDLYNQETYSSYRIFRGGSFAEESRICGATTRRKSHPTFSIDDLGFRLARSL